MYPFKYKRIHTTISDINLLQNLLLLFKDIFFNLMSDGLGGFVINNL